jgi:hypothetical protein
VALFTLTDAYISINGVTLSDHAKSVTVNDTREVKDFTAFGATSKVVGKGLGDASITVEFFQDFAAAKTHATLQPLISSTTPFTVEVRPTSAARSATNPAAVMSALLFDYVFVDGSVGDESTMTATFQNASQTGITYPTA